MSDLYPPEMGPTPGVRRQPPVAERRARSATFWRRAFIGLLAVAAVGMLAFSAYGIYAIRTAQGRNGETLRIVRDCTQPSGKCYERSQDQTAGILSSAQRIILLSAACAVDLDATQPVQVRVQQITACVTERLTKNP